jgi:hypothetical protein
MDKKGSKTQQKQKSHKKRYNKQQIALIQSKSQNLGPLKFWRMCGS